VERGGDWEHLVLVGPQPKFDGGMAQDFATADPCQGEESFIDLHKAPLGIEEGHGVRAPLEGGGEPQFALLPRGFRLASQTALPCLAQFTLYGRYEAREAAFHDEVMRTRFERRYDRFFADRP